MAATRIFLGWDRPALQSAAQYLLTRDHATPFHDLSNLTVVVPGQAAGRRLLELLIEGADGNLVPPVIVTQGRLPELLYPPQRPFASDLVQKLAWAQALKTVSGDVLSQFVRQPPQPDDWQGWIRLGDLLRRQHIELAGDSLNFADVAKAGVELDGFNEVQRWEAMSVVQKAYWELLDELHLWDQQTARLVAIEKHECAAQREIVVIGTVDFNRTISAMLRQVGNWVTVLIDAPETMSDRFDDIGSLIVSEWINLPVEFTQEQLVMTEDAAGQIDAILKSLVGFQAKYALEDIHIGVPDTNLVPQLQRTLQNEGVPTHWPVDRPLNTTPPYTLLLAVCDFLEKNDRESFSALIRHPDLSNWISRRIQNENWLSAWDDFVATYLPLEVDWFPQGDDDRNANLSALLVRTVKQLLVPFSRRKIRLSQSGDAVRDLFLELYGERKTESFTLEEIRQRDILKTVLDGFVMHASVPDSLDLELSHVEAIRLTLSMSQTELYRVQLEPAIQMSGWLEMPLDDAPVAIVTTFNEGFVPESVNHDLFLPNRLRVHLGVEDNSKRYVRDLYHLTTMVKTREVFKVIVSRRDALHEQLNPSRLIFATADENIPQRVLDFYQQSSNASKRIPAIVKDSQFKIPRPVHQLAQRNSFRVTELRDYLASPYRYYLRHILKLQSASDAIDELDGAAFGVLLHDVLQKFGQSEFKDSTQAAEIANFLQGALAHSITEKYGDQPMAAVLIQKEQAQRRLLAFADWQAEWRREGWLIHYIERTSDSPEPFSIGNGRSVFLRGRIDRIDYHPDSSSWALFDYKTGDNGLPPEKTHRRKGEWVDLQLPLYLHLAKEFHVEGNVKLGYIVLPRDTDQVQALFADWTDADISEAYEVSRAVLREILEENFWKTLETPAASMSEFSAICQDSVFGQEAVV